MEKTYFEDRQKQNNNEFPYISIQTSEENDPKEKYKKKSLQRYKFHIFHHNNVLKRIKSTGLDMNMVDEILNSNHSLIYQLIKNNQQNESQKNINMQENMTKNELKTNDNDAINLLQTYYEDLIKKYEKNNNDNMSENINIKDQRRRSFNNENPFQFPLKLDEFTKIKYITGTKGKASVDLTPKKKILSLNEANNFKPNMKGLNTKSSINKFKKLTFPKFIQREQKKSNSASDILSGNANLNNPLLINNKISLFKDTFTNLRKNKKISYINNKKIPNFLYKNRNRNRNKSEFNQDHIKGGVNFKKMLSRDYLNRLDAAKVDGVYSSVFPNYEYIEPKCIMKVSYSNKRHSLYNTSFKGLGGEATFNMDKLFFKYNNHNPPKSFYLEKMAGRGKYLRNKLPIFMLNQVDRNCCNSFNEKNLKMNFYSNGRLQQIISCFDNKKSFNFKLNDKSEEKTEDQINFENYAKKIFEKGITNNDNDNEVKSADEDSGAVLEKKMVTSIPFRVNSLFKNFMSEYKRNGKYSDKIDGITFKNFKIANKIRAKKLL